MEYTEIKNLALGYADRQDAEVINQMDNFIAIVEARVNRAISVRKMSARATVITGVSSEYYSLPLDFVGLRDIEVSDPLKLDIRETAHYLNPEQMNDISGSTTITGLYYTIIADQMQILPIQNSKTLQIVYYQSVPNLSATNSTNWLSLDNPNAYVFGILAEINSFVKDADAFAIWDARFKETIEMINTDDQISRWSGSALQVRTG